MENNGMARKSRCAGRETLSTKVDGEMREWVERRADAVGVTPTELLRRLLVFYQESRMDPVECPTCSEALDVSMLIER